MRKNGSKRGIRFRLIIYAKGEWSLAPAYDLTYSPGMRSAGFHAMILNRNRLPVLKDFLQFAESLGLQNPRSLLEQVAEGVSHWGKISQRIRIRESNQKKIQSVIEAGREALGI